MTTTPPAVAEIPTAYPMPPVPRRRGRRGLKALAVGGGVLVLAGSAAFVLTETFQTHDSTTFSAGDIRTVVVEVDAGNVTLLAGAGPEVHVSTTRHWSVREPHAGHRIDNGVLTITGGCPWVGLGCHVSEEVTIPAGTTVRVTTSAGGVEATNLDVSTFEAQTSAGNITASFVGSPSQIRTQTSAGNVALTVPDGSYHVDAQTSVGDVTVGVVQDPGAQRSIYATTSAGNVRVSPR